MGDGVDGDSCRRRPVSLLCSNVMSGTPSSLMHDTVGGEGVVVPRAVVSEAAVTGSAEVGEVAKVASSAGTHGGSCGNGVGADSLPHDCCFLREAVEGGRLILELEHGVEHLVLLVLQLHILLHDAMVLRILLLLAPRLPLLTLPLPLIMSTNNNLIIASLKIFHLTNVTMAHKMKKMRHTLKNITEQYQSFGFKQGSSSSEQQILDKRETSSKEGEEFIVGRVEEKQTFISSCLSHNINNKTTILPIYGIGGIGKTTFAKMVFNDIKFQDYSQVWVYVSQTFDLNKIGNSIISALSKEEKKLTSRQMIHTFLGEPLDDKKILIVLDDLWVIDDSELNELKSMLKHIGNGNTKVIVIVTTRDKEIADKFCTIEPYELPPLSDDMCWTIIKQKVEFEGRTNKDQLELVGRAIALKCGGVALAAEALGHMLRSMTIHKWESVRDSDIWNEFNSEDKSNQHHKVISSLMLSYNSMPPYLKLCFAYCATFAKGHKIVKDDLIYQWISLGFVEPPGIFSIWENGENYVNHLMGMSFLQYAKPPSTGPLRHEDVTLLTMHDLVHDLARYVMVDEILDTSKQGNTTRCRCRFALLNDCTKPLKSFTHSPVKIRALRFLESDKNVLHGASFSSGRYLRFLVCGKTGFRNDLFSSAKYLHVLDLSGCSIQKLPDSIGQLKQLRYLNAPRVQQRTIPNCVTKLLKLIYLSLHGSSVILTLPESIGEMEALMYLDLSGCSGIQELPMSFAKLKELVHLDLSNCSHVTGVSESLESLTKLEYLNLSSQSSDIKRLPEALSSFINLKYLNLAGFENLEELPTSFGNLKSLMHLDLSNCRQDVNPPMLKISRLENVRSIKEVQKMKLMGKRGIKWLELNWTKNAERFVEDMELLGHLVPPKTLMTFKIEGYNYTKFPTWLMGIAHYLPNLVCITMNDLPKCISLPPLGQLPNLEKLVIKHMKKIAKIDEDFCGSPRPFPRLKKFVLEFMESLEVWNTTNSCADDGEFIFPNLSILIINRCPKLRITPCVPIAEKWVITGSDGVISCLGESVPQTGPSCSPSVSTFFFIIGTLGTTLEVNFSNVPPCEWRFLHHLPAINNLRIRGCSDLTISPEIIGALSSLQSLALRSRYNQAQLPDWLGQLTSLKKLDIKEFDVKALWEDTKHLHLTALQSLSLSGCKSMVALPQWVGDLTSLQELTIRSCPNLNNLSDVMGRLTSLKKLEISFCGSINSLSEGIEDLIKLEYISIYDCLELKQWCEFGENKRKLAHVKMGSKVTAMVTMRDEDIPKKVCMIDIKLWDLPKCNSLPPLGQLVNLRGIVLGCMHGLRKMGKFLIYY
uniref:NBS-LRR disease resistance protein family-4 n=1 Tax=Oryza ridleyi TaxID=83308 RepID=E0CWC7_9ORYZ|nr:NBS-LRR disease resistance protein family-4 [Oryza ridleyi]